MVTPTKREDYHCDQQRTDSLVVCSQGLPDGFPWGGSHTWQSSECPCQVDYPLTHLTLPHSSEHTQFSTPRKQQQWSAASYEPRSDLQDLIALLLVMIAPVLISLSSSLRLHGELTQLLHFHSVQVYSSSSTQCVRFPCQHEISTWNTHNINM